METNSCWIWTGTRQKCGGHGAFWFRNKIWKAQRVSWVFFRGEIPPGMMVLHKCNVSYCVNPDHLYLGTHTDNMRDIVRAGNHNMAKKTHCASGHEFTPENTVIRENGSRRCRACGRRRTRNYDQRKKYEKMLFLWGLEDLRDGVS